MGIVEDTLQKVNAGRVAAGVLPLDSIPKGRRGATRDCPIARAFKDLGPEVAVSGSSISGLSSRRAHQVASAIGGTVAQSNGQATVTAPYEFARFVRSFDNGELPSFDLEPPRMERYW